MKTFSRILFVLPLMALLLTSCVKGVSYESISMEYVTPEDEILPAEGGEITIKVVSTHSFRMSSTSSAFSFFKDGVVNYANDGVTVVETYQKVYVAPNNTDEERTLYITVQHLNNDEMCASIRFVQPVMQKALDYISMEYVTPEDEILPAEGGEITIKVISTHSFRMSSTSSAFSFFKDGVVNYTKDGVAVVESNHNVHVSPNNTGDARTLYITAQHLTNDEMSASLMFVQPAVAEKE